MNVLYTLDSLNRGGAETFVLDLCRNAGRFGITPLFVSFGEGALKTEFLEGGFEFKKLRRNAPFDPVLVIRLRRLIVDFDIDIVHTSQPVEALHAYPATFLTRAKCIQSHQGVYPEKRNRLAARLTAPLMDANIAVSLSLLEWLKNEIHINTDKNFYLAYNAVAPERLVPAGHDLRTELGIGSDTITLGNVGNFLAEGRKDQMTICRAFAELPQKNEGPVLIFAGRSTGGGKDYEIKCKAFCKENAITDRVFFLGERNDVPDILKALDIFVFASLAEGLPIALIEAMLAGVAVVASDIKQNLEVTNSDRNARIFPVGDSRALAAAITELADDSEKRAKIAAAGRALALDRFTMESHFETVLGIYREVLDIEPGTAERL